MLWVKIFFLIINDGRVKLKEVSCFLMIVGIKRYSCMMRIQERIQENTDSEVC